MSGTETSWKRTFRLTVASGAVSMTLAGGALAQPESGDWFEEGEAAVETEAVEEAVASPETAPANAEPEVEAEPKPTPKPEPTPAVAPSLDVTEAPEEETDRRRNKWHAWRRGGSRMWGVSFGQMDVRMPELEDRLQSFGYGDPLDTVWRVGAHKVRVSPWRVVTGWEANAFWGRQVKSQEAKTRYYGFGGQILLGVALIDTDRWLLYPAATLGVQRAKISIDPTRGDRFDDVLEDPSHEARLSQTSGYAGGVLAVDRKLRSHRGGRYFGAIGLRLGISKTFAASGWRIGRDSRATEGPRDLPTVKYAAVALSFGHQGKKGSARSRRHGRVHSD